MSFGWSAGDIVSCIALVVRVSKGLKDSTGAPAEYEAALAFLDGLKTTLDKLKEHLETYPDTFHAKDIEEQAERLKTAVEKFKSKAEKFEASLGSDSTRSSLRRAPRKIQWTLFADSITELQKAISQPQNVLNTILLLQTLKAAEQASRTSALSQQELAKIALAVIEILPAQLRATADSLKLVLTETLESIAEERQIEMLETREEIQKLRDSIEEHGEKFTNLDLSVETQQRLILDAVESCTQAHLESLVEAMSLDELSEQRSDIKSEEGKAVAQTLVSAEGLSSFFGMAAGLHMLGFLISGVLGPMLRGPSAMRTGGGPWSGGCDDSQTIDARFLALFDNTSVSLRDHAHWRKPTELRAQAVSSISTNATAVMRPYEHGGHHHRRSNGDGKAPKYVWHWLWGCCDCQLQAAMSTATITCPGCQHFRCECCPMEAVKIRCSSEGVGLGQDGRSSTPVSGNSQLWVNEFLKGKGAVAAAIGEA